MCGSEIKSNIIYEIKSNIILYDYEKLAILMLTLTQSLLFWFICFCNFMDRIRFVRDTPIFLSLSLVVTSSLVWIEYAKIMDDENYDTGTSK